MKAKAVDISGYGTEHQNIVPVKTETPEVTPEVVTPEVVTPEVTPEAVVVPPVTEELSVDKINEYLKEKYELETSLDDMVANFKKPTPEPSTVPEDVKSFMEWRKDKGGGTMSEYMTVTKDWVDEADDNVLNEYMKLTKPHLTNDELNFEINRRFSFDEDIDEDGDIMAKKIAKKDLLKTARDFFEETSKNYKPSESEVSEIPAEYKEAFERNQEIASKQAKDVVIRNEFVEKTNNYFTSEFEGFKFKTGDDTSVTYNPADIETLKTSNSELTNMLGKYLNKDGTVNDIAGYHKAITIATDPDSFAKFFYEQGKAGGVNEVIAQGKNSNIAPRDTHTEHVGQRPAARKVDIDNSDYKFKLRVKK